MHSGSQIPFAQSRVSASHDNPKNAWLAVNDAKKAGPEKKYKKGLCVK
jgi:hypothetical protein